MMGDSEADDGAASDAEHRATFAGSATSLQFQAHCFMLRQITCQRMPCPAMDPMEPTSGSIAARHLRSEVTNTFWAVSGTDSTSRLAYTQPGRW